MRSVEELLATPEPAWPLVEGWIRSASSLVEVLPPDSSKNREALLATQVTVRAPLGALIWETGGILVDDGWVRVLGGGSPARLTRSISSWNRGRSYTRDGERPPFLLVADDAVGGFFALNGGSLRGGEGHVNYFAPDTLAWEDLALGYSDFLRWLLNGDLEGFYGDLRWPGWREEVSAISGDEALLIYPFLSAEGPPIEHRRRGRVPVEEVYALHVVA